MPSGCRTTRLRPRNCSQVVSPCDRLTNGYRPLQGAPANRHGHEVGRSERVPEGRPGRRRDHRGAGRNVRLPFDTTSRCRGARSAARIETVRGSGGVGGPTGVGKSWIGCALAQSACRNGHSALYVRVSRLLIALAIARYPKLLKSLAQTEVTTGGWLPSTVENRHDLARGPGRPPRRPLDRGDQPAFPSISGAMFLALRPPTRFSTVSYHAYKLDLKGRVHANAEPALDHNGEPEGGD